MIASRQLIVLWVCETIGFMTTITKDELLGGFAERLNALCDAMEMPPKGKSRQRALAALFDVSPNGARKWLDGEGMPTFEKAIRIACWGGVAVEWLVAGRGEIRAAGLDRFQPIPELERREPGDVWRIAAKLAGLSVERRLAIEGVVDAFRA